MTKEYLKMADVFDGVVSTSLIDDESINEMARGDGAGDYHVLQDDAYWMLIDKDHAQYAAHAINSHDELVAEVERLRGALTSSRLSLSNAAMNMKWFDISKAQEILREVNAIDKLISAIGTSDATI